MKNRIDNNEIFEQSCAEYLMHMGVQASDGDNMDCPYRPESDSEAFSINGNLYYDHARGDGGSVWHLALRMNNNDRKQALESLHKSAGVPFVPSRRDERKISKREKAEKALLKVYDAFRIDPQETPEHVLDYLAERKVTDKTRHLFGYIPEGSLSSVLTEEEIELSGLKMREGLIILWYLSGHRPVYYCTRDIETKDFKKAPTKNGVLRHPIWNSDALYNHPNVVWGEGMFDCSSLMEMGYGVCGEITCNMIKAHERHLLIALRWRAKMHPDWTFTICLDNDAPDSTGKRRGNEASKKIALWLWSKGIDCGWVKHDPTSDKIDINHLHQNNLGSQVRQMIDGAKQLSEIIPYDEELCVENLVQMLSNYDYIGAKRVVELMSEKNPEEPLKTIIDRTHVSLADWRAIYGSDIQDIMIHNSDYYVFFEKNRFGENIAHYQVIKRNNLATNLRRYQKNRAYKIKADSLDVPFGVPTWRVSKEPERGETFNIFAPSPYLLQDRDEFAEMPEIWDRVFDNLAGEDEKAWLINHMATYLQTLGKPKTIPVLIGSQGTGKTELARLFGKGIGGFCAVDNSMIESQFNSFLLNPVVLLDELSNSQRDSNQLKNKIKSLINESTTINKKYESSFTADLNNYIIIASNEKVCHVPLVIEDGDRRYSIITEGKDKNLAHESWFDHATLVSELPNLMLYLLSTDIDECAAGIPLANEAKRDLVEMGEDFRVSLVRDYIDEVRAETVMERKIKLSDICNAMKENAGVRLTSQTLRPIMENIGVEVFRSENQYCVMVKPSNNMDDCI